MSEAVLSRRVFLSCAAAASIPFGKAYAIPSLPTALEDIKLKLQATRRTFIPIIANSYSLHDQTLKVDRLEFARGAELVIENLDRDWVAIYADVIALNGPAVIRRTNVIVLKGDDGVDGSNGLPPARGDGKPGRAGLPGGPGREGDTQDVPDIFIFCQQLLWNGRQADPADVRGAFALQFDGYPGGEGGAGGRGGNGSNGTKGRKARRGLVDCSQGPGWGGAGGNAGPGGAPGIGGNGSDGPGILVFVRPTQVPVFEALEYTVKGGLPGRNGRQGQPGTPGRGGAEGDLDTNCTSANRRGRDGIIPVSCGLPDITGHKGSDGPRIVVTEYTGFSELS